jgi:hypothetical protein
VVEALITAVPKEMLFAFRLSAAEAAFSCNESVFEEVLLVAVNTADCALVTDDTFAVNDALVAVAGTVTEAGTVTILLLLVRLTLTPPVGAEPDRLTTQESANDPVIDALLQLTALMFGVTVVPVPLRLTVAEGALLAIVNTPLVEMAEVGSNWTVSTTA